MIHIDLQIFAQKRSDKTSLFKKKFRLYVKDSFLSWVVGKKHTLASYVSRVRDMIKMHHNSEENMLLLKWRIYAVDFWMNVWTEINGTRPAVIYKDNTYKYWEDIIVIPLTSYTDEKSVDQFDVKVVSWASTWLKNDSLMKVRQMRSVSKKRVQKYIGKIREIETKDEVQEKVCRMLGIKLRG